MDDGNLLYMQIYSCGVRWKYVAGVGNTRQKRNVFDNMNTYAKLSRWCSKARGVSNSLRTRPRAQFSINSNDPADTCLPFRKTNISLDCLENIPARPVSWISVMARPSGDCGGVRIDEVLSESFTFAASRSIPNAECGESTEGVGLSVDVRW